MLRGKVTLLDRAKWDLRAAEVMLDNTGGEDGIIDIAAYHCQQCVEKTVKYLIQLQGDVVAPGHETYIYLADLEDEAVLNKVNLIASKIDAWGNQIRYGKTLLSNRNAVTEVITVCKELIEIANERKPKEKKCLGNNNQEMCGETRLEGN
jgi:HEPN domain-containing protein